MTRWTLAGCMALAALGAVAVLDVGSATAEATPSESAFAGTWSGTWTGLDNGQDGTLDWTISDAGRLSGRVYHAQSGRGGAVVGHVSADGVVEMVAFGPADDPSDGCGVPFQGTAVIHTDGTLHFSYNHSADRTAFVAVFERN